MLIVGWTSGVWILSAKTLQSWNRLITFNRIKKFFCCNQKDRRHRRQGYIPAINHVKENSYRVTKSCHLNSDDIPPVK